MAVVEQLGCPWWSCWCGVVLFGCLMLLVRGFIGVWCVFLDMDAITDSNGVDAEAAAVTIESKTDAMKVCWREDRSRTCQEVADRVEDAFGMDVSGSMVSAMLADTRREHAIGESIAPKAAWEVLEDVGVSRQLAGKSALMRAVYKPNETAEEIAEATGASVPCVRDVLARDTAAIQEVRDVVFGPDESGGASAGDAAADGGVSAEAAQPSVTETLDRWEEDDEDEDELAEVVDETIGDLLKNAMKMESSDERFAEGMRQAAKILHGRTS